MTLSEYLWAAIEGLFAEILDHPFLAGLADGTLDPAAFRHYVLQDAHYLRDYARALALCAARAPGEDAIAMFAEHAAGAVAVELTLHQGFLAEDGISAAQAAATPVAPATQAYTSYLVATCATASFPEALGAVLPCYWIYQRVGAALLERGSPDPRYRRWIDTYGGEEFGALVAAVLALVDRVGADLGPAEVARVRERFVTTSRYEWMFWDGAWRRETWPI